ncbi:hypothetical protein Hanom_Chr17g01564421 [Helianthus anomalus]
MRYSCCKVGYKLSVVFYESPFGTRKICYLRFRYIISTVNMFLSHVTMATSNVARVIKIIQQLCT